MTTSRAVACLVGLGLTLLAPASVSELRAQTADPRSVTFLVHGNAMFVEAEVAPDSGGVDIEARLADSSGVFKAHALARSSPGGSAELRFTTQGAGRAMPIAIVPGDVASVRIAGGEPTSLAVSDIAANFDAVTRIVSGNAPPGRIVTVTAVDQDGRASVTATADGFGRWMADFGLQDVEFAPGTSGHAYYREGTTTTQTSWAVPGVELRVGADIAHVFAATGAEVALQVEGPTSALTSTKTWGGHAVVPSASSLDGEQVWMSDSNGDGASLPATGSATVVMDAVRDGIELPAITLAADPATDVVTGTARPGTALVVEVAGTRRAVVADWEGAWSTEFGGDVDIAADTEVAATAALTSASGIAWNVTRAARSPRVVSADATYAAVDVQGQAGDVVSVAAAFEGPDIGRTATGTIGPDGTSRIWVMGDDGEAVRMADVGALAVTIEGALVDVSSIAHPVARAHAADDIVEGDAPPGSRIEVHAGEAVRIATTGEDGRWTADFAGGADLVPGMSVSAQVSGRLFMTTTLSFPVFRANAQVGTERVRVEGPPGLSAEFELERAGRVVGRGSCRVSESECSAALVGENDVSVPLEAGDTLLAYSDGDTDVLDLVRLSAHIDPSGRDVVGLSPPDATLFVDFANGRGGPSPPSATTWSDSAGVFDHELPAVQWPLLGPGVVSDVYFTLPNGHRVFSRGVLERAQAYPAERLVSGQAEPSASITVTVDTGEWLSATYTQASSVGEYSVLLPPGVVIEGSTVRVDHNRGAHEMQIQGVVAWALPPGGHAGLMTGRDLATTGGAPDGVPVEMVYRRAEPQPLVIVRTESSHGGGVHAGGPMTNRSSVLRAEVHAWLPGAFVLVGPLDLDRANSSILLPSVRSAR